MKILIEWQAWMLESVGGRPSDLKGGRYKPTCKGTFSYGPSPEGTIIQITTHITVRKHLPSQQKNDEQAVKRLSGWTEVHRLRDDAPSLVLQATLMYDAV